MSDEVSSRGRAASERGWWIAAAVLVAIRFFHLGGPLDDPHSWRQAETARYSLEFVRHGIDLLRPAVVWLGPHRTLIFEFPLPEAISAALQRAFGVGEHWDRIVGLGFFLVATLYLHLFARFLFGARLAWLTTVAWLAFPLGQFYSRAAHVDFAATAGAHALLYHGARLVRGGHAGHAAGALAGGVLAALIKAPYLFPVLAPLALLGLSAAEISGAGLLFAVLAVTAVGFKLWRAHVDHVNAAAPDWSFLPGYYKEVNPLWWYIGEWKQRLDPASWSRLVRRLTAEVATPPGVLMAFAAPLAGGLQSAVRFGPRTFAFAWAAGAIAYLLVFFPLNVIHNYYQIPFLAPAALLVALGFEAMWARARPIAAVVFLGFLAMTALAPERLGYYRIDWLRVEAGRLIEANTPREALLVAVDHASIHSDPRLLHRADRFGWPVALDDVTPDLIAKLQALGATRLALVIGADHPEMARPAFLEPQRERELPIVHDRRPLGTLTLYRLDRVVRDSTAARAGRAPARRAADTTRTRKTNRALEYANERQETP